MTYLRKFSDYLVIGSIMLFILIASYFRGLFFDEDLYLIETIFSLIFLFYIIINFKNSVNIFNRPYLWALIVIDLLYIIMSLFANNQLYALQQSFRWILATQVFVLVLLIKDKKWVNELIWISLLLAGVWTSAFGWLAAYNLVDFKDAFLSNRISSVFQYANTFGAFIAALLIGILIRATSNKWVYSLSSIASYLLTITIIFTYSRGTWLVLPVIWLIALFFLKLKQQILYILHTLIIGIAIIITLPILTETIAEVNYVKGFSIITISSLLVMILYTLLAYLLNRFNFSSGKKFLRWIIPTIALIAILLGLFAFTNQVYIDKLPENLANRISSINSETRSVQERNLFYHDSKGLIKESPIVGHGGGAWRELYKSYQSYPYESSQAHSFYFQFTIEIGLLGLLLFISFIILILISIVKNRENLGEDGINRTLTYFFIVLLLLTHSFIDFDMSFGYILVITFIMLALIAFPLKHSFYKKAEIQKKLGYLVVTVLLIMTLISVIYTGRFHNADKQSQELNQLPLVEVEPRIDNAISLNPYNVEYRFLKINVKQQLYDQTKIKSYKDEYMREAVYIRELDSKDPNTVFRLSQTFASDGYLLDAVQILEESINNSPWQKELYEQYFVYAFNLAQYYQQNGNLEESKGTLNNIINYHNNMLVKREFLDQQIPSLRYPAFRSTQIMDLYVGQAYIISGDYNEGLKYLTPLSKSKDQSIKESAISWMVYAYEKQNMQDKANEYLKLGEGLDIPLKVKEINDIWK